MVDLLDPNFDADYDIGNEDGIKFGDIYYLNYHGINLFFYVCGLDRHRVRIYELAKKRKVINGINAEFLTYNLNPTTSPKVVLEHNSWTKSEFWVETTKDKQLIIPVSSPLYLTALRKYNVTAPITGSVYAYPLKEEKENGILNYYWPAPKICKKTNKIKIIA